MERGADGSRAATHQAILRKQSDAGRRTGAEAPASVRRWRTGVADFTAFEHGSEDAGRNRVYPAGRDEERFLKLFILRPAPQHSVNASVVGRCRTKLSHGSDEIESVQRGVSRKGYRRVSM